jgi:F420-dependent oxidoreductase-like protein
VKIAVSVTPGPDLVDFVTESERLGVDSVWTAEAWGYDAFTPLAYLAARTSRIRLGTGIAQVGARTPAMTAMSAMSMQALSNGRFILGLGTSGPQVMEAWHGVAFANPVARTRETIEIVRAIARGDRVTHGDNRPIRSMAPPVDVPIYVASLGPRNLRLTGELADGWIGTAFVPESADVFLDELRAGASSSGRSLADLEILVPATVEFTDDVEDAARRHARGYAFTFGAMGSREKNFYNDAFTRQGFGEDVRAVQQLWLDGKRDEAAERVPAEIGLKTNLIGTPDMIRDRLGAYRDAGVTTIRANPSGENLTERLETLARLMELA